MGSALRNPAARKVVEIVRHDVTAHIRWLLDAKGAALVQSPAATSTRFATSGSLIDANLAAG
jgi:hypothetical protein